MNNTRLAAAASIAPLKPSMLARVIAFVTSRGEYGATDEEIAIGVKLSDSTARARRVDLRDEDYVSHSGNFRKTRSGRDAIVWHATGKPFEGPGR